MGTVSRTELNQRTAHVLARVAAGEDITVTDRGEPVARISPVRRNRWEERLAAGKIRPATATGVPVVTETIDDWTTEQWIEEMRGDRS